MGKTCLAKLFKEEKVVRNAEHTIGLDYLVKDVKLKNGTLAKVSLYILSTVYIFSLSRKRLSNFRCIETGHR